MELHRIETDGIKKYVLIDDNMRLVQPVNRYLDYQRLRGRSANTIKAYGQDLKTFFVFLKQNDYSYENVDAPMIQAYIEYLKLRRTCETL